MDNKLTDGDVRIVYLPPMTMASIYCVGDRAETDTAIAIKKLIQKNNLPELKPDFRLFGFNHKNGDEHGYERWISVPDDFVVNGPFQKIKFTGGLYCSIMRPLSPNFYEGWEMLYGWLMESKKYEIVPGDPEKMNGMLNEDLNIFNKYVNIYDPSDPKSEPFDEESLQLDLMIPIKEK